MMKPNVVGCTVQHKVYPRWGDGIVVRIDPMTNTEALFAKYAGYIATVDFENRGRIRVRVNDLTLKGKGPE